VNSLNPLQHILIGPDATDADESRRDYMTRVVFAMMGVVLGVFTLVIAFGWGVGVFDFEGVAVMLLMDVPIAAGWWLARHEHWRLARYIPIAVTLGLALYGTYFVGLVTTLVLFYVLAILLAAMLYGGKVQWIVLGLSILTHLVVGWSRTRYPFSDWLQITVVVSGSFTGIALLQWLSTNQLQRALASARVTAMELQAEITERKRSEEALRESEDKYRQLFDLESDAIVLVDNTTSQILEANAAASVLYGYDREEWLTMKNTDVSAQAAETRRITVEGGTWIPVCYHRNKDGAVFPVEITARHFTWQGRPVHIAAIRDITQRKQAEEALRESERKLRLSEEHLRATLDYAPIGMATSNRNGRFLSVNREFARMLNYSQEDLCHMTFLDITAPGDLEESRANVQALWNGDVPSFQMEKKYLRKDSTVIDGSLSVTLVYDMGGQPLFAVAMINDITERKQAEEALQEERSLLAQRVEERTAELRAANVELGRAVRLKDEFLANMSHELRTPLNAILGLSESLQEQVYGPLSEKQRLTLHTIEGSGRHLLSLINDILDLSKIGANKLELQVGWTSAESVCQASLAFIKQSAHKKKIGISYTFDNAVTVIQADERRLKQILVNLLGNAVKFTPEGGKVGLEVVGDAERQVLDLTVWDTGIGIRQEDRARLFQPFVQVDAGLSRQYSGTGLGLALVQQLTEMHGGSVKVESEVGKGSRFTVSLPWREPREGAKRESNKATQKEDVSAPPGSLVSSSSRPVKVLVAEDNEEGLYTLTEYLLARGYRVIEARNGMEAIEQAGTERPAVIVMDIQMPGMDGLEAIRRIRADADLWTTPIIALTALAMPGDRERCLEAGANEYLSKPVSMKELVTAIETQVQRTGDPTAD
jgi:PAS domain S-box-containing protein